MTDNDNKILEDTVGVEGYESDKYRIVQLSSTYTTHNMEQVIAHFRNGGVQSLVTMHSQRKPKRYEMTEAEMDNLVETWVQFKADLATLKAAKEAEKLQKFKETWAEIERLAESVPGMKISTMDSTWFNYDAQEDMPHTQMKLPAIGFERVHLTLPGKILDAVIEAVEQYNRALKNYEDGEKVNWQHWNTPGHVESGKKFLAAHREWVASKEPEHVG